MKECETEANTPLPRPLSSTLCSQLNQNAQETYPRYCQQDFNKVWEDELLHNNKSPVQQSLSCKRTIDGFGEGDQNDQDLDEGGKLLVNHSKKMRIVDNSEDPTSMFVSDAELSQSEDKVLEKKASPLSCLSGSTPSTIGGRQHVFPRHNFADVGAFPSFGVFPSFNPIDVPKQPSITNVPCGEHSQLNVIGLGQQTQLSSSERKLMSRAQRQRQIAFVAQQQLPTDLATLEPHEHESMKEAAQDTFAILDNLGANDTQFSEHVLDFINHSTSVAHMTKSIECLEKDTKHLEDENAKLAHIRDLYAKTEAQFQASFQQRQSLCKEISHFEAMLFEKQNQLKSFEMETSNIGIELDGLRITMLEADTTLKARTEQAEVARKLRVARDAKQIAAKSALEKALLELEY